MNARYPDANTAESEEGTAAHWVMVELLSGRQVAEDTLSPNGVTVTGEMIEGAELVAEVANDRVPGAPFHIEETVRILAIHPDCFGTPDIWSFDELTDRLEIIDFKFGHRFVDEWFNTQGLLYMLGIIGKLPSIPTSVSFTIVQPRCFYRGEPVRTHTYRLEEATVHLSKLREAAEAAYHPNPIATTGAHCEHCPGRHACPALQKAAYEAAETSTDQQPTELTPAAASLELSILERKKLLLDARVEGLREQTSANLRDGKHVPHYRLESGRGRLAWKVLPEQVIKLGKKHKQKLDTPKVLTPTQAKKLIPAEVIDTMTEIIPGQLRLIEQNNLDASRIFGHTSRNADRGTKERA